jgi:Domain of unknown function (DUF4331)
MSSHREAPQISKDPVADNTDVYVFVSPDAPSTVTIIANYIPLEDPAGGPNFFNFGDDVLYSIYVDNDGDAKPDITYQFRFKTQVTNPGTFLYNTGPIGSLTDSNWNVRQTYTLTRVNEHEQVLGRDLPCPPCRIGPRSTPSYANLAGAAVRTLGDVKVFAGQRDEGFFVDLGSIFDLGTLRPVQNLHLIPSATAVGRDGTKGFNVHTIAIQVPKSHLTRNNSNPDDATKPESVIGVWAAASRQKSTVRNQSETVNAGPWTQVSRLGNPLINEVIIPLGKKDAWNSREPRDDGDFTAQYEDPELQNLLPVLYPAAFPNLKALLGQPVGSRKRADLVAILLTGIPSGIVPGFQNFTGSTKADMLRLNLAIPPSGSPNPLGIIGGDLAGFPNGRRVIDDVVAIELRAIAGATYPLVAPSFTPDAAATAVDDGLSTNPEGFLSAFPYLQHPNEGYDHQHD